MESLKVVAQRLRFWLSAVSEHCHSWALESGPLPFNAVGVADLHSDSKWVSGCIKKGGV